MNIAHAVNHHPLRDSKCWGVIVTTQSGDMFSTGPGSYCLGKPLNGMTLQDAHTAMCHAVALWRNSVCKFIRLVPDGSGHIKYVAGYMAFDHPDYTIMSDEVILIKNEHYHADAPAKRDLAVQG